MMNKGPMNKLEKTLFILADASVLVGDAIDIFQYDNISINFPFYETHIPALLLVSIATMSYYMRDQKWNKS